MFGFRCFFLFLVFLKSFFWLFCFVIFGWTSFPFFRVSPSATFFFLFLFSIFFLSWFSSVLFSVPDFRFRFFFFALFTFVSLATESSFSSFSSWFSVSADSEVSTSNNQDYKHDKFVSANVRSTDYGRWPVTTRSFQLSTIHISVYFYCLVNFP